MANQAVTKLFNGVLKNSLYNRGIYIYCCKHYQKGIALKEMRKKNNVYFIGSAAALLLFGGNMFKNYMQSRYNCNFTSLPSNLLPSVYAKSALSHVTNEDQLLKGLKLNHRERRFMKFSSVEFQGQLYLTPQDFIESVTESEPRPRLKRKILKDKDIDRFLLDTPFLGKAKSNMFRQVYDKGIISYTEYLFLLSILTKPQSGFKIAFNMFDTDGNKRVDKEEFLVLEKIFSTARRDRLAHAMEDVTKSSPIGQSVSSIEDEFQKSVYIDTTILIHFFGKKGKQELRFEDFKRFMENLQSEILEIEFNEFSKGLPTISELDFAKILLRYTYLQSDQYEMYLERLLDRIPEEVGITFIEFKSFCQFLNTLDDFAIAMKMYTLADHPISQEEFHRAVKICTGTELSLHIVDTVFKIFDDDGDGQLSYTEFIAIMRNRLHRGFKKMAGGSWNSFKLCVRERYREV